MTLWASLIPRGTGLQRVVAEKAIIKVSPDSSLLAYCHFSPAGNQRPTFVLIHGLEGSSESYNILGLAQRAFEAGANVVRLNLRNCGDSLHLTPTLYNAGLTSDLHAVLEWLVINKKLTDLFLIGFSLGGNLVLKTAAELASRQSGLSAVCAISPSIDLDACVLEMERGIGRLYELNFLASLKRKILQKEKIFPGRYDVSRLKKVTGIRQFDDTYTAPDGGYAGVEEYYLRASSLPLLNQIAVPTLIITAKDDPIVPFRLFTSVETDYVRLLAPSYGGHGGFMSGGQGIAGALGFSDSFWADEQILRFCFANSKNLKEKAG